MARKVRMEFSGVSEEAAKNSRIPVAYLYDSSKVLYGFTEKMPEIIRDKEKNNSGYLIGPSFSEISLIFITHTPKNANNATEYIAFRRGNASEEIKGRIKMNINRSAGIML